MGQGRTFQHEPDAKREGGDLSCCVFDPLGGNNANRNDQSENKKFLHGRNRSR